MLASLTTTVAHADKAADKCALGKLAAGGKTAVAYVRCYQAALKKGVALDQLCLMKADEKLAKTFARLEKKGGCVNGNFGLVRADIVRSVGYLLTDFVDARVCLAFHSMGCASAPQHCCPGSICALTSNAGECIAY